MDRILIIVGVICFGLAAIGWPKTSVSLGWLGAFLLGLTLLI